jgi:hypothetical protein
MLLVAFLAAPSRICQSDEFVPPPKYPGGDVIPSGTIKIKPATVLRLGKFSVQLEITTLSDVQEIMKAGLIQHQGDASESLSWLCYTVPLRPESQRVWISSSEMGGGTIVDGVAAEQVSGATINNKYCPLLPKKFRPIKLDHDIWIGINVVVLERILGKPLMIDGEVRIYDYNGKKKGMHKNFDDNTEMMADYDEISSLVVKVRNGKVISLWASKVTSY